MKDDNTYICYRCYSVHNFEELRQSSKINNLSVEESRKIKMCKNCKCRIFIQLNN